MRNSIILTAIVISIFMWAIFEILCDITTQKEEPKTFIVPKEEMLFFKAGYFMGGEAVLKGYNLDSAWAIDSATFYNKFFKLKTTKS